MAQKKKNPSDTIEMVAKHDQLVAGTNIENMILSIRGAQVMIDRDLAMLYGVETKVLNQAVKRNIDRFPERFRFQLSKNETDELVTNCDRLRSLKHSSTLPHVTSTLPLAVIAGSTRYLLNGKGIQLVPFWNILHRRHGVSYRGLAEGLGEEMVRF